MLTTLLTLVIISNAATTTSNRSILYSRAAGFGLLLIVKLTYNSLHIKPLDKGLGIYNNLFNVSTLTQSFTMFIVVLGAIILVLTAFYPRKLYKLTELFTDKSKKTDINTNNIILGRNNLQFAIIEYTLIIIFVLSGAVFLISAGDLVSLFLSIELQSYGLYILATIYRDSESATGSGLTYFLLGGLSSCFILLGSAILYVNSGTTNLDNIYVINSINEFTSIVNHTEQVKASYLSSPNLAVIPQVGETNYINFSFIILTVGLLFKISAAPFHFWSPDVYDGIPTIVTTFVAVIAKISLLILMLELILNTNSVADIINNTTYNGVKYEYGYKNILILSSLMSLVIGSLLGLTQFRIKRLFAYSTISHVGFILLALCINSIESIQGYTFYILQYSMSNLNAFFILIAIGYTLYEYVYVSQSAQVSNRNNNPNAYTGKTTELGNFNRNEFKFLDVENSPIQLLSQLKGYFHINSFLSISFAITLFSFVGIPPLIGFFAKQMVLSAALDQGYVFMTIVGVITSVIGAAYYLNIVKLIFFSQSDYVLYNSKLFLYKTENKETKQYENILLINDKLSLVIAILTMLILLFIFMPDEWFRIVSILSLSVGKC